MNNLVNIDETFLIDRRSMLGVATTASAAVLLAKSALAVNNNLRFDLSLVETSLTRSLRMKKITHLDFVRIAKEEFEIDAVEYASEFFPDGAPPDEAYIKELNKRAAEFDVRQLLIAVSEDVRVADPRDAQRQAALQVVRRWIDAAQALGCHSVQINPNNRGTAAEQGKNAVDAIAKLCEYAELKRINVLLGNYGQLSADGTWIEGIINSVDFHGCRTIPRIKDLAKDSDYRNLSKLLPFAKGLTADTSAFKEDGGEVITDYARAIQVVDQAGYRGYIGINYRGRDLDEKAGIRATQRLLKSVRRC